MWPGVPAPDENDMTLVQDLAVIPAQRIAVEQTPEPVESNVPLDVLAELRHISECYLACRARAEGLRTRVPSGDREDRDARDSLVRALQRLHELRERRSALLDTYDLPSTAGL